MADVLVKRSAGTVRWLAGKGLRWRFMYERQAYVSGGKWVFFGGLALGTLDGGKGLIAQHTAAARASGVVVRYGAAVTDLVQSREGCVRGCSTGIRMGDNTR